MSTSTGTYQIIQKVGENEYVLIHPETVAENVLVAISGLKATNVAGALEEVKNAIPTKTSQLTNNGDGTSNFATVQDVADAIQGATGGEDASAVKVILDAHMTNKNNPHGVTKTQVGLGHVDDTSDLDKPVSTAQQTALNAKEDKVNLKALAYKDSLSNSDVGLGNVTNHAQVKRTEMGVAGGVATLDSTGKVPTAQLPSFVDDVLEFTNKASFPATGADGKIYVDETTNKTYRWGGTSYVEISASLALGETASTAYPGDKGKANADNIVKIIDGTTKVKKAETADKLSTARKISLSGDATGETTFDGSADKTIPVVLKDSGVTAGTYSVVTVNSKGCVTSGQQLIEIGVAGQTVPSADLAPGGLFLKYHNAT